MNDTYPSSFRKGLEKGLRDRGVHLILDDFVDDLPSPGDTSVKTRKGNVISADLVVRSILTHR